MFRIESLDNTDFSNNIFNFNLKDLLKSKVVEQRRTARKRSQVDLFMIMYSDKYILKGPFRKSATIEKVVERSRNLREWDLQF